MTVDKLDNIGHYRSIHPNLDAVIEFIAEHDIYTLEAGRYNIQGNEVYAVVSESETVPLEQGVWEVHRHFIDIQCIVAGGEGIGYTSPDQLVPATEYDEKKDMQFFTGTGPVQHVAPGEFMLLMAGEAHASKIATRVRGTSKKVLFKVKM